MSYQLPTSEASLHIPCSPARWELSARRASMGRDDRLNTPHLAETVQLQAAGAHGVHDGGVVDDAHGDAQRARTQLQVRVRCRAVPKGPI